MFRLLSNLIKSSLVEVNQANISLVLFVSIKQHRKLKTDITNHIKEALRRESLVTLKMSPNKVHRLARLREGVVDDLNCPAKEGEVEELKGS